MLAKYLVTLNGTKCPFVVTFTDVAFVHSLLFLVAVICAVVVTDSAFDNSPNHRYQRGHFVLLGEGTLNTDHTKHHRVHTLGCSLHVSNESYAPHYLPMPSHAPTPLTPYIGREHH